MATVVIETNAISLMDIMISQPKINSKGNATARTSLLQGSAHKESIVHFNMSIVSWNK